VRDHSLLENEDLPEYLAPLVSNCIETDEDIFDDAKGLLDALSKMGIKNGVSNLWLLKTIIIIKSLNKSHSDLL